MDAAQHPPMREIMFQVRVAQWDGVPITVEVTLGKPMRLTTFEVLQKYARLVRMEIAVGGGAPVDLHADDPRVWPEGAILNLHVERKLGWGNCRTRPVEIKVHGAAA